MFSYLVNTRNGKMTLANVFTVLALSWLLAVKASPEEDNLKEHNRLREKHGVPALTLDDSLSKDCAEYAQVLAEKGSLVHSPDGGLKYGENLCLRSEAPLRCVQDWYDEIKEYDFAKAQFTMNTGHFTALVWKSAKKMGHGQAKSKNGIYFVVARYYPPVNIYGQFKENVPKPIDGVEGGSSTTDGNVNMVQANAVLILFALCLHFTK
ncbi:Golgi-associated plant pathogenesis-related protein 1-like [Drosophila elegans]|uniref:Golgi-associated plant pathogenesis-related protein 1-like n=1 Tax=Drosophila elegans TaxID=30023 RepID=UPI0007E76A7E|nr:Golgi-associated plant pathogenesis-related protein 1-like [Drosophila elegans]